MWYWIKVVMAFFFILIIVEESLNYVWNRYVYGNKHNSKTARFRKWLRRLQRKHQKDDSASISNDTDS